MCAHSTLAPTCGPTVNTAKPIATCKLQSLAAREPATTRCRSGQCCMRFSRRPTIRWRTTSVRRWAIGRCRRDADRSDPWLRLLLLAPKRPVVVDLAVFIDGKPFRESREAWIDDLLDAQRQSSARDAEAAEPPGINQTSRRELRSEQRMQRRKRSGCGQATKDDEENAEDAEPTTRRQRDDETEAKTPVLRRKPTDADDAASD